MNTSTNPQKLRPLSIALAVLLVSAVCAAAQSDANPPAPRVGNMTRHGLAGVVTSISGSTIVMQIPENVTFTVQISPSTRIVSAGQSAAATDIHPGDPILASGDVNEQARTIQAVAITIQAPLAAKMFEHLRANFGKTWTAGIVTAVQSDAITVQRRDRQSQTFTVDDGTTWRLNDREGTPAMIRVGESIRVQLRPGASAASQVSIQGMTRPN
ncbi:MAG: DUF5666 domain-containing protein [Acidobacteriaceae bacterium]